MSLPCIVHKLLWLWTPFVHILASCAGVPLYGAGPGWLPGAGDLGWTHPDSAWLLTIKNKEKVRKRGAEGKSILFSVEVDTSIEFSSYMGHTWMHKLSTKIKIQTCFVGVFVACYSSLELNPEKCVCVCVCSYSFCLSAFLNNCVLNNTTGIHPQMTVLVC